MDGSKEVCHTYQLSQLFGDSLSIKCWLKKTTIQLEEINFNILFKCKRSVGIHLVWLPKFKSNENAAY